MDRMLLREIFPTSPRPSAVAPALSVESEVAIVDAGQEDEHDSGLVTCSVRTPLRRRQVAGFLRSVQDAVADFCVAERAFEFEGDGVVAAFRAVECGGGDHHAM